MARYPTPMTGFNTPEAGPSPGPSPRKRPRTTTHSRDWDTEFVHSSSASSLPGSPRKEQQPSRSNGTGAKLKARDLRPDASFVSPSVASAAVRRFVAKNVVKEGYDRAEGPALHRFELEVVACECRNF